MVKHIIELVVSNFEGFLISIDIVLVDFQRYSHAYEVSVRSKVVDSVIFSFKVVAIAQIAVSMCVVAV